MEALFNTIVQKTQSDLLLFMVLLTIVAIIVAKPLYKQITDYLTLTEQRKNEREGRLLDVVQGNSSVMAELKTLLTNTNENCRTCKTEQLTYFKRFEQKQDTAALVLNDIEHNIDTIAEKLKLVSKLKEAKLNKIETSEQPKGE